MHRGSKTTIAHELILAAMLMTGCRDGRDAVEGRVSSTETESPEIASPEGTGATESSEPSETSDPHEEIETAASERLEVPLGMARAPWRVMPDLKTINEAALRAHRAENYPTAIVHWRTVLADAPEYDGARFNLACALEKSGDSDAAMRELRIVLAHDLPRFSHALAEDEDLATLRASDHWPALESYMARLRTAYREAAAEGLPSLLLHIKSDRWDGWEEESFIVGVYRHAVRRFLPLSRLQRNHLEDNGCAECVELTNVLVPADATRASLAVRTSWRPNHGIDSPLLFTVPTLFDETRDRRRVVDTIYDQIFSIEVCEVERTYRYRASMPEGWMPWRRMPSGERAEGVRETCMLVFDDSFVSARRFGVPEAFSVEGNSLTTPHGTFSMPSGPQRTLDAVVQSETSIVVDSHHRPGAHTIDRIDLRSGETQRIRTGAGQSSIRLGADDALYIDVGVGLGVSVLRYAKGATEPEATMMGLRLH